MELCYSEFIKDNIKTIVIENKLIKISILPDFGGKILEIIDKDINFNHLWVDNNNKHKNIINENFDEQWFGGFDEMFPCDAPMKLDDVEYTDHGFLWNIKCDYNIVESIKNIDGFDNNCIILTITGTSLNNIIYMEKTIEIYEKLSIINYSLILKNISNKGLKYLHKLHPAFYIDDKTVLNINGSQVFCEDDYNIPLPKNNNYKWPNMETIDNENKNMSLISNYKHGDIVFQTIQMNEGKFKIEQRGINKSIEFIYDIVKFPYLTCFISYGGFNNFYTAVIEPSKTFKSSFDEEFKEGRISTLKTNESYEYKLQIKVN